MFLVIIYISSLGFFLLKLCHQKRNLLAVVWIVTSPCKWIIWKLSFGKISWQSFEMLGKKRLINMKIEICYFDLFTVQGFLLIFFRIMLFIIGLPVSQIVLFCVTIGHDPIGLNIAIVNYELPPSEMLKPCKLNVTDCSSTLWSCKYLTYLDERKGNLVCI